jgi:CheY-like chemotaxis protein
MTEVAAWVEATFQGCAANVGPLIGVDLQMGEISTETTAEPPGGELAVMPLNCEADEQPLATATLSSPLAQIVTLARRMIGAELDKEGDLSEEDLEAIGEILNSMSGAVDECIREHLNPALQIRPLKWWRTDDPGGQSFEDGEHLLASVTIAVPDGTPVELALRLPALLRDQEGGAEAAAAAAEILLLGLKEQLLESLRPLLESARLTVHVAEPGSPEAEEALGTAAGILLSGDEPTSLELCRSLRKGNRTWHIPTVLCSSGPTKQSVIDAMEAGASHVLVIPTDEPTLLRVLNPSGEAA